MKLFGKKEEKKSCCCGASCTPERMKKAEERKSEKGIKILGTGCAKCQALEHAVQIAVAEAGLDIAIEHITDFAQIASYGVMSTPALVLDGTVVSYGRVLSVEEVKTILEKISK